MKICWLYGVIYHIPSYYLIRYRFLFSCFVAHFIFRIHLILFTFQVLAYILSTVDDTKLLSKVGFSSDVYRELFLIISSVAFFWKFLNLNSPYHRLLYVSFKQP